MTGGRPARDVPIMDRDMMADQVLYWLRSNHHDAWHEKLEPLSRPMQRYRLQQIADAAIRLAEQLLHQIEPEPALLSRDEAIRLGRTYFYTGPCHHGHYSARYVRNGHCVDCNRLATRRCYERTTEVVRGRTSEPTADEAQAIGDRART